MTDPALTGTWTYKGAMFATGTGKMPVISNTQSVTLTFNNDGTFTGFGGCNNYNGGYTITGQNTEFGKEISFSPIASTKKYCADTADFETPISNTPANPDVLHPQQHDAPENILMETSCHTIKRKTAQSIFFNFLDFVSLKKANEKFFHRKIG